MNYKAKRLKEELEAMQEEKQGHEKETKMVK